MATLSSSSVRPCRHASLRSALEVMITERMPTSRMHVRECASQGGILVSRPHTSSKSGATNWKSGSSAGTVDEAFIHQLSHLSPFLSCPCAGCSSAHWSHVSSHSTHRRSHHHADWHTPMSASAVLVRFSEASMTLQQKMHSAERAPLLTVAAGMVLRAAALDAGNLRAQALAPTLALSSAVGRWRRGDVERATVSQALRDARGQSVRTNAGPDLLPVMHNTHTLCHTRVSGVLSQLRSADRGSFWYDAAMTSRGATLRALSAQLEAVVRSAQQELAPRKRRRKKSRNKRKRDRTGL